MSEKVFITHSIPTWKVLPVKNEIYRIADFLLYTIPTLISFYMKLTRKYSKVLFLSYFPFSLQNKIFLTWKITSTTK